MRWIGIGSCGLLVSAGLLCVGSPASGEGDPECKWKPVHAARVARLGGNSSLEARLARADVAHLGTAALPALNTALHAKSVAPAQLRSVVSAMLVSSVPRADFRRYPALIELLDADVKRARAIATPLFDAKRYDSGQLGLAPPGSKPPPLKPCRAALKSLLPLDGAAALVAIELTTRGSAAQRLFGAELLVQLGAHGQRAILARLEATDRAAVDYRGGCVIERTTVGTVVGRWLRSRLRPVDPAKPGAVCLEAERYLRWAVPELTGPKQSPLLNRLRQEGKTWQATSFADYWTRATPILRSVVAARSRSK